MLEVRDLKKYFVSGSFHKKSIRAVDGVDFTIERGKTLGLVGESGCGKTTLARMIAGLLEPSSGRVTFKGLDIFEMDKKDLKKLRLKLQIIFQNPYEALNPRMLIREAINEPLKIHKIVSREDLDKKGIELADLVGLNPEHLNRYPHELSGGQLQRAVIARALAVNPEFIVADEPTSALDVNVQAQILNILREINTKFSLTCLFISHDLEVIKFVTDHVGVMYLGKLIEIGETHSVFKEAKHPYTKALLSAAPVLDPALKREKISLLGEVPDPSFPPSGCRFHTRCQYSREICKIKEPFLIGTTHKVACHFPHGEVNFSKDRSVLLKTRDIVIEEIISEKKNLVLISEKFQDL